MIPMNKCSLVIYNIFLNTHMECIYSPNEKEMRAILDRCYAKKLNGNIVCTIKGDWRNMDASEIHSKCCQCIKQEMVYW